MIDNRDRLETKRILYIDDNEHNLNSFRANFRRDFEIYTALTPEEGYRLIHENNIPIIVSDFKMPEQNGVIFLEQVKERFPNTVRIMLTGHADLPAIVDSINRSEIFRFLVKPWSERDVRNAIAAAFDLYYTKIQLSARNEELKKAYLELDRLVFSTAHDITGPLSNIMGLISLTKMEGDESGEYLNLIEYTAKKLRHLVKDVLTFHRNKRTALTYKNIRFKQLMQSVLKEYEYFENASEVTFDVSVQQDGVFCSDKSRLRYILNNLISNAIKYQDKKKPSKRIKIVVQAQENELLLKIEDNGIGIDVETQAQIFNIYYRGSKQSTGAGIGLYIVKEAVDLLGGTIELKSILKQGSAFEIRIPNRIDMLPETTTST